MATADEVRRIAMALDGTAAAPHFDRTAIKVERIYMTLAADGNSANLKLAPDEQELKCLVQPNAFSPVPNAWGRQGWTTMTLAALSPEELEAAVRTAWRHAVGRKQRSRHKR